ncbi:MAG: hypothetical protein ABRQ26_12955 [Syntrophomonadaceae bacterium]
MKKDYEKPDIYVEEYEIENTLGNLCSGIDEYWPGWPGPQPVE